MIYHYNEKIDDGKNYQDEKNVKVINVGPCQISMMEFFFAKKKDCKMEVEFENIVIHDGSG